MLVPTTTKDRKLTKVKALLYGDSGIGKTTSIATLPVDRTVLVLGERSSVPLRHHDFLTFKVHSWSELVEAVTMMMTPPDKLPAEAKDALGGRDIFVLDSLTKASEMCVQQILTVDRPALLRERTGDKRDTPDSVYKDQMVMEDYGAYRRRMANLINAICGLPMHVIVTSLAAWSKDRTGGDVYRAPNLFGRLSYECPGSFDLVLHMETKDDQRVWRTFNDGEVIAKDCSGVLDKYEVADWSKLLAKIAKEGA